MSDDPPASPNITIIDFWAEWCGTCRMIEPVVNRVVAAHSDVALRKVNIADSAELATRMDVRGLPTLVFVANDGRELARLSGVMTGNRIECALSEARAGLLQL